MTKKVVPHSVEAEEGVLGSILLDKGGMTAVGDLLTPASFYLREHQLIYEAMEWLTQEKKPVDLLTVRTYLDDRTLLGHVGGNAKLIALTESIFTTANIEQYARTVRSKHIRRQIIQAGSAISLLGTDDDKNMEELFASLQDTTKKLTSIMPASSLLSIEDGMEVYQVALEENKGKTLFGWSWGENFKWLDYNTKGIRRKKTYRMGAKSGMGKTQMGCYNLIPNLLRQGAKVAFFTLENDMATTINNLLANMQGVDNNALMNGDVKANLDLLFPYRESLSIIEDTKDLQKIFKVVRDLKPDVVVLDYIGLIKMKGVDSKEKFTLYSEEVQGFTKEQDISWVDLSNLRMGDEDEPRKIVAAGQFFGASELRNNLDVGIHIIQHEPFKEYKEKLMELHGEDVPAVLHTIKAIDVWITKNRGGPGEGTYKTFILNFKQGGRMREATKEEKEMWKSGF